MSTPAVPPAAVIFCNRTGCKKGPFSYERTLNVHISTDHNKVTRVLWEGVPTLFTRNPGTKLLHCRCGYTNLSSKDFSTHCRQSHPGVSLQSTQGNSEPPSSRGTSSQSEAGIDSETDKAFTHFLSSIGFQIQKDLKVLCCIECEHAYIPDHIPGHCRARHGIMRKNLKTKIDDLVLYYNLNIGSDFPTPAPGSLAFAGIGIVDGLLCSDCNYVSGKISTARKHAQSVHKGAASYKKCKAQTIFHPSPVRFFKVALPKKKVFAATALELFAEQVIDKLPQLSIGSASTTREIPPLLQKTQWHKYLEDWATDPYKRALIRSLVMPASTKEPWSLNLSEGVQLYMQSARDFAFSVDWFILQKLMRSSDPEKIKAWRALDNDGTLQRYAITFGKLLIALLRSAFAVDLEYKFPLDAAQANVAKALYEAARDGGAEDLQECIHAFAVSIFSAPLSQQLCQKWSSPLLCYLAVDNLREDGAFTEAHHLTTHLAQWKYIIRSITLLQAKQTAALYENGLLESIDRCCEKLVATDKICAFNSVLELQAYASSIAMARANPPCITWSDDFSSVAYKGEGIKIQDMRSGLANMEQRAYQLLDDVSLNQTIPYHFPEDLIDDMTDDTVGYSWLENGHFLEQPHALYELLLDAGSRSLGSIAADGTFKWNRTAAHSAMLKLQEVNRLLCVLLHIVTGQPSRGTEHVDTKIRNSWRLRNMFYQNGKHWMITQYTKTTNASGRDSFIPALVPPRLAKLLEYYLIVFRPLECTLAYTFYGGEQAMQNYHDYLFVEMGSRMTSEKFSEILARFTREYMNVELTLQSYRHVAIAIKREFIPPVHHITSTHEDEVGDSGSGHTTAIARRIYATKNGDLPYLTTDAMRAFATFCSLWHSMFGFGSGPLPQPLQLQKPLSERIASGDFESLRCVLEEAVKSVLEAEMRRSLESLASDFLTKVKQILNSRFPENPPPSAMVTPNKRRRDHIFLDDALVDRKRARIDEGAARDDDIRDPSPYPNDPLPFADDPFVVQSPQPQELSGGALDALRACYDDDDMDFKSDGQRRLVLAVLDRREDVVAILPTGGGKSAAFEIPAKLEEGMQTVVIVPFVSIVKDILRRCQRMSIKAYRWKASMAWPKVREASLVIVVYESAVTPAFQQCVKENFTSISRFVYDECHQIYLAADLRPKLPTLHALGRLPFPQIYLTATLPPHLVETFKKGLGLDDSVLLIREGTERPEIQYSVLKFDRVEGGPTNHSQAIAKAKEYGASFDTESRGVIFCRSIEGAKAIAKELGCSEFHAKLSDIEQAKNFEDWMSGKTRWMAATSGFMNGIDCKHVEAVVFMDPPYGMLDLVQGSGRGGRGGRPSKTTVIADWKKKMIRHDPSDWKCEDALASWVTDRTCRRLGISLCMDGTELTCTDRPGMQLCDICSQTTKMASTYAPPPRNTALGSSQLTVRAKARKSEDADCAAFRKRANAQQSDADKKKALAGLVSDVIKGFSDKHCIVCYTQAGEYRPRGHTYFERCLENGARAHGWRQFKKLCTFARNTHCFFCWTPQKEFKLPFHIDTGKPCNLQDILCLCAWTVYHNPKLRNLGERKYGWSSAMTDVEFGAWLAKESSPAKLNNAIDLFSYIVMYHEQNRINLK